MASHRGVASHTRRAPSYQLGGDDVREIDTAAPLSCKGSADEAVGAVGVLDEVLGVPAGITAPVLRKEYAIGVVSPPRTSQPNVIGPEAPGQVAAGYRAAYLLNEPAHGSSVAA